MITSKKLISTFAKSETMNSYEFWKVLNKIREGSGANLIEHSNFLSRAIDECELSNTESFRVKNTRGNKNLDAYNLNKRQMLLIGMRESKTIRSKVLDWVEELSDRVHQLEQEKINRSNASLNYLQQNKALQDTRKADGKETMPYHFSNEANLINNIVLGCTAKSYRAANGFDKTVNLRDTLSIVELECVASLESTNKEMINICMDYQSRKEMLLKVFKRDFASKLIDEHLRLEA